MRSTMTVMALAVALVAGGAQAKKSVVKHEYQGVVNLNTATAQQLDLLPGVGEKAAKRIIEHRSKTPFAKPDDLMRVKGFGKKKLEKLRPYVSVSGPTTLKEKKGGAKGADEGESAQGRTSPIKR
jgi:competence protein ComEA